MIEKLENQSLQTERRLTDLMKEDASGNLLGSTVYFGKSRADAWKQGNTSI